MLDSISFGTPSLTVLEPETTLNPLRANFSTIAQPIPLEPPVTTTVLVNWARASLVMGKS
jgi:hypothetical protein